MTHHSDIKLQRDRFVAFSFAGADLLMEVDSHNKVNFVTGAIQSLLGCEEKDVIGKDFLSLFSASDQLLVQSVKNTHKIASKQGPYLVTLISPVNKSKTKRAFLSGFRMSPEANTSIAISQSDGLVHITGLGAGQEQTAKLSTPEEFESLLRRKIPDQMAENKDTNIQLVQLPNIENYKKTIGTKNWSNFMSSVGQAMMDISLDGESVVKIDHEKYMFLKDEKSTDDDLNNILSMIAKNYNIEDPLQLETKEIVADPYSLSAKETTRAILYTLKKMEVGGLENCTEDLKESFEIYLKENANKVTTLKRTISRQEFDIYFQPIVSLLTEEISHHEVLIRFDKNNSPYETIILGEECGISADIDLSVCRQTMKYIDTHKNMNVGKLAVNISGASIQNDAFVDKLLSTLKEYPSASQHLIFEITESSEIKELEKVDRFIQQLRTSGYSICLDDFGAGAASFQYLQKLHVDGVKIDGSYVKKILSSSRDATMVKNITKMCHELDIYVVAEMIETREQANFLRALGIDKGQGWLFSKAVPETLTSIHKQED